jgi:hypothetical protein
VFRDKQRLNITSDERKWKQEQRQTKQNARFFQISSFGVFVQKKRHKGFFIKPYENKKEK